jgi:hypothetical protein
MAAIGMLPAMYHSAQCVILIFNQPHPTPHQQPQTCHSTISSSKFTPLFLEHPEALSPVVRIWRSTRRTPHVVCLPNPFTCTSAIRSSVFVGLIGGCPGGTGRLTAAPLFDILHHLSITMSLLPVRMLAETLQW